MAQKKKSREPLSEKRWRVCPARGVLKNLLRTESGCRSEGKPVHCCPSGMQRVEGDSDAKNTYTQQQQLASRASLPFVRNIGSAVGKAPAVKCLQQRQCDRDELDIPCERLIALKRGVPKKQGGELEPASRGGCCQAGCPFVQGLQVMTPSSK